MVMKQKQIFEKKNGKHKNFNLGQIYEVLQHKLLAYLF